MRGDICTCTQRLLLFKGGTLGSSAQILTPTGGMYFAVIFVLTTNENNTVVTKNAVNLFISLRPCKAPQTEFNAIPGNESLSGIYTAV